jgi:hypothetical protein
VDDYGTKVHSPEAAVSLGACGSGAVKARHSSGLRME